MKKKTIFKLSSILLISFILLLTPIAIYADETDTISEEQTAEETEQVLEQEETTEEEQEETTEEEQEERSIPTTTTGNPSDDNTKVETTSTPIEEHKVAVITTKVDQDGNPLSGAVLQIIDSEGNVVDEWTSDGTEHTTLLPEGNYVLHEVSAPEGYKLASDKAFTVQIELNDVTAGVVHDDSHDVCWHHKGVPLFYIESNGEREEVYCINQGWEEPHDVSYDGVVLTEENIKSFMPDADPTMTAEELYNKVLDIVYHRTKAEEEFPDLTETEIRMITEYALKNYTSAQYDNGNWARQYAYSEDDPKGYVEDEGNGTALGRLAIHWWGNHGRVKLPQKYADFYYYLVRDEKHHPDDMYLYVWSTKNVSPDGEAYQNLLGIRWHNPYDENQVVKLTMVNEKKEEPKREYKNPQTGDNTTIYMVMLSLSLCGLTGSLFINKKEF